MTKITIQQVKDSLYKASPDSFQIRIPTFYCTDIDARLINNAYEYVVTQDDEGNDIDVEMVKELKRRRIVVSDNGCKTSIMLSKRMPLPNEVIPKSYKDSEGRVSELVFGIHSKHVGFRYLEGVSSHTIETAYSYLMSLNLFKIDYEDFLTHNKCTDLDLKLDFEMSVESFKEHTKEVDKVFKPNKDRRVFCQRYKNGNIQFNDRIQALPSRPYLKYYQKELEAQQTKDDKHLFYEYHFDKGALKNIHRIEATINSDSFKKFFNVDKCNIQEIIKLSQEDMKRYISYSITQNTDESRTMRGEIEQKPNNAPLKPQEELVLEYVKSLLRLTTLGYEDIRDNYMARYTQRERMKKIRQIELWDRVYNENLKGLKFVDSKEDSARLFREIHSWK